MVSQPTLIRITAHATPRHSDPPNADEFYAMLGKLIVAWGRLEGYIIGALLMILALSAASTFAIPLPIAWEGRNKLWKQAFNKIPALKAHQGHAIAFMGKVIDEAKDDRNFATHAIWGDLAPWI
jgi:hypothetical protein